jgi:hypothetical protein
MVVLAEATTAKPMIVNPGVSVLVRRVAALSHRAKSRVDLATVVGAQHNV